MKVLYDSLFSQVTGRYEEERPFSSGTVADLIESLAQGYGPRFRELAVDPTSGGIPDTIAILVNGQRPELSLKLREGDEVAFLMPLAGGEI